ncbi:hypothetical protein [Vibrio sp. D431a]|uniref:hypothetical protein n=1 Tax=Vibrio sp. D431a TaxID=2837388 RepID=UPI0025533C4D|nr:hypothetical protein [Vibrio sp. D431a]MDK9793314.1 hypothetical protein [Vibrio sp. D431a]
MAKKKQLLIARIFFEKPSTRFSNSLARIGIHFSYIENKEFNETPSFLTSFDLKPIQQGLTNIMIRSTSSTTEVSEQGLKAFEHSLQYRMNSTEPSISEAENFTKAAKSLWRKVEKLESPAVYSVTGQYAKILEAAKVDAVTFETHAEKTEMKRFKLYTPSELEDLLKAAVSYF